MGDSANGKFYFSDPSFDCSIFEDNRPSTVSLSILVTIEMFNTFNALSENQSLFVNPPWANIWVVLAVALSMALHCMILYVPFFRSIFSTADSNFDEWCAVLAISFPVIIFDEVLKLISRQMTAAEIKRRKQSKNYQQLSQFHRLSTISIHSHHSRPANAIRHPMWTPSFSFHFTVFATIKRLFRRIKYLFVKKPTPTLPYYNPVTNNSSSSLLNHFLSSRSTNDANSSDFNFNIFDRISYFAKRLVSSKKT